MRTFAKTLTLNRLKSQIKDGIEHEYLMFEVPKETVCVDHPHSFIKKVESLLASKWVIRFFDSKIDKEDDKFELIFTWSGLNFKGDVVTSKKKFDVVFLDHSYAKSWDGIEEKILNTTLLDGNSDKISVSTPWRYSYDFFKSIEISEIEKRTISRIEIKKSKCPDLSFVISDHMTYQHSEQVFLEQISNKSVKRHPKVDLEAEKREIAENNEYYKKRQLLLKNGKTDQFGVLHQLLPYSKEVFATSTLASVANEEATIFETMSLKELENPSKNDDDYTF